MPSNSNTLTGVNLDHLKYEVARELGYHPQDYRQRLEQYKYEVASELGIPLRQGYNGDLTSREAGRIGGRIGGPIGGHMVRKMIQYAEEQLAKQFNPNV